MDRASGSGVFARDPDALLDMIELPISEEVRGQRKNNAVCRLCGAYLERYDQSDKVSQDDLCSRKAALDACMDFLPTQAYNALLDEVEKADAQEAAVTAWRIEGTLREFPRFPALNVWFEYPVHHVDRSGVLADIQPEAEQPAWKRNLAKSGKRTKTPEERERERSEAIDQAFAMCESVETPVTVKALAEYMGKSEKTIRRDLKANKKYWIDDGQVGVK
jgi:RecA-family ATPase